MTDRLDGVRGFVVDLDGTTYLGDRLIDGARPFFEAVAATGRRHVFVTNNSSESGRTYETRLRHLGLTVADGQVLTSGEATAMLLQQRGQRRVFVVGTPELEAEMIRAGLVIDDAEPDCVVLGFDRTLTYQKLVIASRLIARGARFVATHPDRVCPTPDGYIPDCGAMIALLEAATGVSPLVVGKPEPLLVDMALARLGLAAGEVAVIGDRLYTDIAMAQRSGTRSILVLSGETTRAMLETAGVRPDVVVDHLGALVPLLAGGMAASSAPGPERQS